MNVYKSPMASLSATLSFAYNYSIQKCSVYHTSYFTPYITSIPYPSQSILFYITYRPQACLYEWLLHNADETLNRGSLCWTRFGFKGSSKCPVQRNEYELLAALYRASSSPCCTRFGVKGSSECPVQRNEYKLLAALHVQPQFLASA